MTPDLHDRVIRRDMRESLKRGNQNSWPCVAMFLVPNTSGPCYGELTLDHVKDQPLIGDPIQKRGPDRKHRYRAPSDERHLVTLCRWHHIESGWATSHRGLLRWYLRTLYE